MKRYFIMIIFALITLTSCQADPGLSSNNGDEDLLNTVKADVSAYGMYLKKIWIVKENDRDSEAINDYPSFFITDVNDGMVTGSMSVGSRAYPDCYVKSFDNNYLTGFSGVIENGAAKCQYGNNKSNTDGEIELIFKDKEIEAVIRPSSDNDPVFNKINGKKFVYHPYNIQDEKNMSDVENYAAKLNYWGEVNITTGYINAFHPSAVAYITDNDGNILYEFEGITNGVKIADVKIEDINNDNLSDIKIMLDYPDLVYIYIQMADGSFYDSKLDSNEEISNLAPLP